MRTERIKWIDTAKGIGIIAVILGHLYVHKFSIALYAFHLPLFFFLGGYTLKTDRPFGTFLKKRVLSLLVPYIFAAAIICVFFFVRDCVMGNSQAIRYLLYNIKTVIIQKRKWSLWFLSVLFFLCVIYYPLHKRGPKTLTVATAILFALGLCYNKWIRTALPLNLDIVFVASPYFATGVLAKEYALVDKYILKTSGKKAGVLFAVNLVVAAAATWISYAVTGERLDLCYSELGVVPLTYIAALTAIAAIIYLCSCIEKHSRAISSIGANSFVYFAFHQQIFITLINDCVVKYGLFTSVITSKHIQVAISFVLTFVIVLITAGIIKLLEKSKHSFLLTGRKRYLPK